jgi:hypothetical protein
MAKTKTPKTAKPTPAKRDRHSIAVILTASGTLIAGKRRIEAFTKKNPDAKIVLSEIHHYAMLPYLHAAKDEDGHLHLATLSAADENDWTIVSGKEA